MHEKAAFTIENMPCLWILIFLAKKMACQLGRSEVLQQKMQNHQKVLI